MAEELTKRLYVPNVEVWQGNLSKKRLSNKKLEVKVIERGIVLPVRRANGTGIGGVCDNDFNFVAGYSRTEPGKKKGFEMWGSVESGYTVDRKELVQLDEDVIFCGFLIGHFGHFIMEGWNRLWYVVQNPELKSKILFIQNANDYKSWFEDFFKLMGIDNERIIYVKQPMQFRSVTVPDQSQYTFNSFTKEYLMPYQAIKSRVTPGNLKKIYLTRTNFDEKYLAQNLDEKNMPLQGHCFNEKYFEDFFANRKEGYKVIAMENLSIEEQVSLITGADEIVSTLGTLSNWAMFCKPNARFITLNRTHDYWSVPFQSLVNEAVKLTDFYVIDVSKDFMYGEHYDSACMLGATKYWKEFVADYFGESINEDDDNEYFEQALDKYVNFWYKKYSGSKEKIIDSLKNMCNRINTLEMQLNNNRPLLSYQTHVAFKGWSTWNNENTISNDLSQMQDIQAIKINFTKQFYDVYYSVYYNDKEGWASEVSTDQMAGTTGKGKAITGVKIRLDEAGASDFDIFYRVHTFDGKWTDWAKNGEELLSQGVKLNAIQIKLKDKIKKCDIRHHNVALETEKSHNRPLLSYQTHVAKTGWGDRKNENQLSNPLDQQLDIQAIKINFTKPFYDVYYSVYYNDKEGWSEEVSTDQMAGTTGKGKAITGVKIRLDEAGASDFDIFYRVHTFDGKWTDWAKNGEEIYSHDIKLNAIQIKLKDKAAT